MNKKQGAGLVVAIIAAIASGSWALNIDLSNTTNIDSHDETNITIDIINQLGLDITAEELDILCNGSNELQEPFRTACNIIARNTGN